MKRFIGRCLADIKLHNPVQIFELAAFPPRPVGFLLWALEDFTRVVKSTSVSVLALSPSDLRLLDAARESSSPNSCVALGNPAYSNRAWTVLGSYCDNNMQVQVH